jgi:hypothetical protein
MTLNDILHSAQGGQAVANLGSQFGLAPEAAEAAVQAMIPAFSSALTSTAANPASIGAVLNELTSGAHAASFTDPSQTAAASGVGGSVLGQVFGSPQAIDEIVRHVAAVSGVNAETIRAMLPAVASMLIGGLAHAMANQGLSGVLGQLANAVTAPGGLGSTVPAAAGSSGGLFGSLIGSVFGGAHATANPEAAALAAGFATLSAMFVSGVQVAQANQAGMSAIAQSFTQPPPGAGV